MSDSYQAIYDAVRSKISNGDIGAVARDVMWQSFEMSHLKAVALQEITAVGNDWRTPHVLMRPSIKLDGNQWCALYGDNLQDGVAGFGKSPEEAMFAFDKAWSLPLAEASHGK